MPPRRQVVHRSEFGRVLLERRTRARLSQQALAKLAGVSSSLVNILERGQDYKTGRQLHPSVQTIQKLSEALAVDPFLSEDRVVVVNDDLRDEIFEALFGAMEYDLPQVSLEAVRSKLIAITGNPELVDVTLVGFKRVPDLTQHEQSALVRTMRGLLGE